MNFLMRKTKVWLYAVTTLAAVFCLLNFVGLSFGQELSSDRELTIVYTADVKGELEPCG